MKNSIFVFLILFINTSYCAAQHQAQDTVESANSIVNGLYAAIVPSALFNPWTGYQAKLNYGFLDLIQLQLNAGWLNGKRGDYNFSGYRFRPAVKLFFLNRSGGERLYFGLEYNIRKTVEKGEANYNRFGGAYREMLPFERTKELKSFIFSFGSRSYVSDGIYIESSIGLGVGPLDVTTTHYPNAQYLPEFRIFRNYPEQGEYSLINLLIHFSVGMKIF